VSSAKRSSGSCIAIVRWRPLVLIGRSFLSQTLRGWPFADSGLSEALSRRRVVNCRASASVIWAVFGRSLDQDPPSFCRTPYLLLEGGLDLDGR